jgi:hypothetical protein
MSVQATAFVGHTFLTQGPIRQVAERVWAHHQAPDAPLVLVFNDETGQAIDIDLRGDLALAQLDYPEAPPKPRGRPKLGVKSKEVTLLPRHWVWLDAQPKSASATLRGLVQAQIDSGVQDPAIAQRRCYSVMQARGGSLPNFEQASRLLFRNDIAGFLQIIGDWPEDLRVYLGSFLPAP